MSFGNIFKGLGHLVDLVKEMEGSYSFSVRLGELKDNHEPGPELEIEQITEPNTDIFEEEDRLLIFMQIPGAVEDKIEISQDGDILCLKAFGNQQQYLKEIILPWVPAKESMKVKYLNGILEIHLKK